MIRRQTLDAENKINQKKIYQQYMNQKLQENRKNNLDGDLD